MLFILLLIPFAASLLLLLLRKHRFGNAQRWALLFTLAANALLFWLTLQWSSETPITNSVNWIPQIGLEAALWLDGPALFWAWLVLGIGFFVVQYSRHYLDPGDAPWRFYSSLMAFMGSMLGVVISRNVLLMYVFWEMTSILSFILIGHWHHKESARQGARRALWITAAGGLCILGAIATITWILRSSGVDFTMRWDDLWLHKEIILAHPAAKTVLLLLLVGAFTKSAQFPFHVWLPGAMEAPTPVSAYLHAATMVKAGIYLLGRMYPIFQTMELWLYVVATVGVVTMIIGGFIAIVSSDLKLLLAWSTISQLGLIVSFYGFGFHPEAGNKVLTLDLMLVVSHALFKAGLFMVVGVIDHGTGTRDWKQLGGLARKMPWSAACAALGCASMAGYPLTLGFVAKKIYFEAAHKLHAPAGWLHIALYIGATIASIFTVAYCLRFVISPFFGKPRDGEAHAHAHEGSWGLLFAPVVLIFLCFVTGVYVPLIELPLRELVHQAFFKIDSHYSFAFYHLNQMDLNFWVSVGMLFILGPITFWAAPFLEKLYRGAGSPKPFYKFYDGLIEDWVPAFALRVKQAVQSPSLRRNSAVIFVVTTMLVGFPLIGFQHLSPVIDFGHISVVSFLFISITVTALCAALLGSRSGLIRIITLGFIGLLVTTTFVIYKAPDLAITQMLIELVTLLMMLLLLPYLNFNTRRRKTRIERPITFAIALCFGTLFSVLSYAAINSSERKSNVFPERPSVAEYYLSNARSPAIEGGHSGGGANVVNVILVDFRGMDTFGEITVLLAAALGVMSLVKLGRRRRGPSDEHEKDKSIFTDGQYGAPPKPLVEGYAPAVGRALIMRQIAPMLMLLGLLLAAVLLFTGHNSPGGGFIAALLTAGAMVPYFLAFRRSEGDRPELRRPLIFLPIGLLLAVVVGFVPVVFGYEFLHSAHTSIELPLLGTIEIASAMFFDFGVYLVVIGVTLLILKQFGKA